MSYSGGSLTSMFSREAFTAVDRALHEVADAAGDSMLAAAVEATPRRTGKLAGAWTRSHVDKLPEGGYRVTISNASPLAHLAEYGTDPHRLAPDDAEAILTPEGPRASAEHPGTTGHHMTAKAVAAAEALLEVRAGQIIREWMSAAERSSD